jgi:hypothetical protein
VRGSRGTVIRYTSATGLDGAGSPLFAQDTTGVAGAAEAFDLLGFAAGDFDNDGFADLAAGAPFEGVGATGSAGAVTAFYGPAGGLGGAGRQLFTQDTAGYRARLRCSTCWAPRSPPPAAKRPIVSFPPTPAR